VLPQEVGHSGNIHASEQSNPPALLYEENHTGGVAQFGENGYSSLPYESCDGSVPTLERDDPSTTSREKNHNGHVAQFEENDHSTLPHENCDGDVYTWEPADHSTLMRQITTVMLLDSRRTVTDPKDPPTLILEENYSGDATPSEETNYFTIPHEENHHDNAHTRDGAPCGPYDAPKITNIKEQNRGSS